MPDGSTMQVWELLKYLWIGFVGLFVWNGKRIVGRVDKLDLNSVDKDTFNNTLNALRNDIKELGKDMTQKTDNSRVELHNEIVGIHKRIDTLSK